MSALYRLKAGDKVAKLLMVNSTELVAIATIAAVDEKRGLISTDTSHVSKPEDIEDDGVQTYRLRNGLAVANYIPGCSSRLVAFDGGFPE